MAKEKEAEKEPEKVVTALEYVKRITEDGGKVLLSGNQVQERKTHQGQGRDAFFEVRVFNEEKQRQKVDEMFLVKISELALNVDDPRLFYEHVMLIIPKLYRNGEYDELEWTNLLKHITLSLSMLMTGKAWNERFTKSATNILSMLQTRSSAWNKKVQVSSDKKNEHGESDGGYNVVVNIT